MKLLFLGLAAPLLLIGATSPDSAPTSLDAGAGSLPAPLSYRPCRPGPGDDRCIQLYERGVRESYARWQRTATMTAPPAEIAMGGPAEDRPRRARVVDERCVDSPAPEADDAGDDDSENGAARG
ncbi:MAG: hypothetical protein ACXWUN_09680 [Allosphingosinicella sp.]